MLYVGTAAWPALVDDDIDAAHALVAREMLERHDWVVLYQDGIRYPIRPPLHFWLIAASYELFGQTAFATRLPVALAVVGLVLLTFAFGRRFLGERAGLYGALAVATSPGIFFFTRTVIPEAIYAFEFVAIFYLFLRSWTGSLDRRLGYPSAAAVCGLAVLTRGPIGFLFPAASIAVFLLATGGWRRWRELRLLPSAAVFFAVAVPWHVLAERRSPGFAWAYFVNEHVLRALGRREPHDYSAVPLGLWLLEHAIWLFPWSVFVVLVPKLCPHPRSWKSETSPEAQARLLLFVWTAVIVGFFSLEGGSRMEYYSFGAWPAMALLLGVGLARSEERNESAPRRLALALAIAAAVYAAASVAFVAAMGSVGGDITADLESRGADLYRSAMARALDLTPRALADLRAPLLLSAGGVLVGFVAAWRLRRRGRAVPATVAMAAGMAVVLAASELAYDDLSPSLSSRTLAERLNPELRPSDLVALYGDIRVAPGIAFYCHRRVLLYDARQTNLRYGSRYADAPKTLYDDEEFLRLWSGPDRVILIVPADRNAEARERLPAGSFRELAAAGGKTAYVNRAG